MDNKYLSQDDYINLRNETALTRQTNRDLDDENMTKRFQHKNIYIIENQKSESKLFNNYENKDHGFRRPAWYLNQPINNIQIRGNVNEQTFDSKYLNPYIKKTIVNLSQNVGNLSLDQSNSENKSQNIRSTINTTNLHNDYSSSITNNSQLPNANSNFKIDKKKSVNNFQISTTNSNIIKTNTNNTTSSSTIANNFQLLNTKIKIDQSKSDYNIQISSTTTNIKTNTQKSNSIKSLNISYKSKSQHLKKNRRGKSKKNIITSQKSIEDITEDYFEEADEDVETQVNKTKSSYTNIRQINITEIPNNVMKYRITVISVIKNGHYNSVCKFKINGSDIIKKMCFSNYYLKMEIQENEQYEVQLKKLEIEQDNIETYVCYGIISLNDLTEV